MLLHAKVCDIAGIISCVRVCVFVCVCAALRLSWMSCCFGCLVAGRIVVGRGIERLCEVVVMEVLLCMSEVLKRVLMSFCGCVCVCLRVCFMVQVAFKAVQVKEKMKMMVR